MSKNTNLIGGLNFKTGNCKQLQPSAKAKKIVTPEEIIQVDFFDWVFKNERAFPVLRWIHHVPNGGYRHPAIAVKMKLQGVRAGVCDCFLPVARKRFSRSVYRNENRNRKTFGKSGSIYRIREIGKLPRGRPAKLQRSRRNRCRISGFADFD